MVHRQKDNQYTVDLPEMFPETKTPRINPNAQLLKERIT